MLRMPIQEREDWEQKAKEFGFLFHTMYGEKYWDESAYYQFSLEQVEKDIEDPSQEIHEMCLSAVERVINDSRWMEKFKIPEMYWDFVRDSWVNGDPSLYSRLDLAYSGRGPAKFFENNADTPTSLYESGFWQWLWLEDQVDKGRLNRRSDQYNSLQEKLVNRLYDMKVLTPGRALHFSCCKDTEEDRGTVQYIEDCAKEAGIESKFVYIEDIGLAEGDVFTDLDDQVITWMFKLYPWEFMFREEFGQYMLNSGVRWIEPPWKSILSNKALLPLLWEMFPNHPNLLPAFFEEDIAKANEYPSLVKKPLFSREGANITVLHSDTEIDCSDGPYGEEGYIYQSFHSLPKFGENYTLIGSWLVDDEPAGISIREDSGLITRDMSRYLPHIILD